MMRCVQQAEKKVHIKCQKTGYFDFQPGLFCIKLIGERKQLQQQSPTFGFGDGTPQAGIVSGPSTCLKEKHLRMALRGCRACGGAAAGWTAGAAAGAGAGGPGAAAAVASRFSLRWSRP